LKYELRPRYGPTIRWCDIPVTQIWRCGNRGNVASVLIEKPGRGDFQPILDGGFGLQFSPLMEYREGKGLVILCQLDLTARTEPDPAADAIAANLIRYISTWKPQPARQAAYAGEPAGKSHLESAGVKVRDYDGGQLAGDEVMILGPNPPDGLQSNAAAISRFVQAGGRVLAIGLDQQTNRALLPTKVSFATREHISTLFEPPGKDSPFAGIGPAEVEIRGPHNISLLSNGATVLGDGVLGSAAPSNVIFCQIAPWQFDYQKSYNLKRTYRRCSFLLARVLGNLGVTETTPLLDRFHAPLTAPQPQQRWLEGLYLDIPEEWDEPYRFFRW
jgi:beta-galactosidase